MIGTVGRLDEVKCQDLIIRSFARIATLYPEYTSAARRRWANARRTVGPVESAWSLDRVHFAGYQKHPEQYLSAMDIFALTSRTEGMPLSVLEAWAAGLPVVASRVGGLPKLVEDGRTGCFFSPGDGAGLESCLLQLLENPGPREHWASGEDEVRSRYSVRRMTARYLAHYHACTTQGSPACSPGLIRFSQQ